MKADLAEHLEAPSYARLRPYADRARRLVRARLNRRDAARVPLQERDRLRAEPALAALVRYRVVRRGHAPGVEEVFELAQPPGAQLARLADRLRLASTWVSHVYFARSRESHAFFGRTEHELVLRGGDWRIAKKKILLQNDYIPTMLDVYCV